MTIGQWIRAERESRKWSQDKLAFRAHVSSRLIGRYERGEGEPNIANLVKIADAFGEPLPWSNDSATGSITGPPDCPMLEETFDVAHA
jgi:transcriptional regulator with XRE-family HTH domain